MKENLKIFAIWIRKQMTFTKLAVFWILYKSIGWIDQSYALAWAGKEDIAETLSKTVVTEVVGVFLLYCVKAIFEQLSKNNQWPDKTISLNTATTKSNEPERDI